MLLRRFRAEREGVWLEMDDRSAPTWRSNDPTLAIICNANTPLLVVCPYTASLDPARTYFQALVRQGFLDGFQVTIEDYHEQPGGSPDTIY